MVWVSGAARQQVTFFCLPKRSVTQEKGTPLPRPYGLNLALPKKSGGRPNSGLKALRQVRPTAPDFFGKARRGRGEEKLPSPPTPLPGGEGSKPGGAEWNPSPASGRGWPKAG